MFKKILSSINIFSFLGKIKHLRIMDIPRAIITFLLNRIAGTKTWFLLRFLSRIVIDGTEYDISGSDGKVYEAEGVNYDEILANYIKYAEALKPYVTDTNIAVLKAVQEDKKVLFEGAQATMLDLDHGTYPFVTSSHPIAGGASTGAGVGPNYLKNIFGVVKAYATRVGAGPFPTELLDETGENLRKLGHEFGTVTGRPRRCGWLDLMVVKYAAGLNSLDYLAITRLDILDTFKELKICVGYKLNGKDVEGFPANLKDLEACEAVYETLPGWETDISGIRKYEELPENARKYVERIAEVTGVPLGIVSVGPNRSQTIDLVNVF